MKAEETIEERTRTSNTQQVHTSDSSELDSPNWLNRVEAALARSAEFHARMEAKMEERLAADAEHRARVDETARTVATLSETVTRITADTEQQAKLEVERRTRVDEIARTVAELSQASRN